MVIIYDTKLLALKNTSDEIKINGKTINDIRYAEDTDVIFSGLRDFQQLVDITVATKLLVFSKVQTQVVLRIRNNMLEQV